MFSAGILDAVVCNDHLMLCRALGQGEPAPGSNPTLGCAVLLGGTGKTSGAGRW